jgi:ribosomal peptide maturation radical SAM protein 1
LIVFINMPFSSLFQPSLALSQFKSQLAGDGIPSSLLNLNFEFARRIGFKAYEPLRKLYAVDMRIGEWLFAREAWGAEFGPDSGAFAALCRDGLVMRGGSSYSPEWMDRVRDRIVPEFLEETCHRICGEAAPEAVGFSCMFFQTVPSLALARRIKNRHSGVKIIFGGACLHSEMGAELIAKAPWIDIVSTGEADHVICRLARSVLKNQPPEGLEGILYRDEEGRVRSGPAARVADRQTFESLPAPDFGDFMADAASYAKEEPAFKPAQLFLPFESSRGCWWGEKKQCAFCGLNAENMEYRSRSAGKTLELIKTLADRYPVRRFFAADNNMPLRYYRDFLPEAARCASLSRAVFFYEIKTNVSRRKVQALSRAGVKIIQPGIETLSTHILECMRKGVTALNNIHLLKLCRIFGITPMWNCLIRVPGERIEDYEEMMDLVPKIVHLHPPTGRARMVQLHRFSPYFRERGVYVEKIRAQEWYAGLFPEDRIDLKRIAYYFHAEWKNTVGSEYRHYARFTDRIESWISAWCTFRNLPALSYDVLQTGPLDLTDTRFGRNGRWRLDEEETAVYRLIDDPASAEKIEEQTTGGDITPERIRTILREFVKHGLAMEEAGIYLGLALPEPVASIPLKIRREVFKRFG